MMRRHLAAFTALAHWVCLGCKKNAPDGLAARTLQLMHSSVATAIAGAKLTGRFSLVKRKIMSKVVPPGIQETAFCCPHCSAFTTQYWYKLYGEQFRDDQPIPFIVTTRVTDSLARRSMEPASDRNCWRFSSNSKRDWLPKAPIFTADLCRRSTICI